MVCDDTATATLRSSPTQPHSSRRRSSVMGQRLAATPHEPLWPVPLTVACRTAPLPSGPRPFYHRAPFRFATNRCGLTATAPLRCARGSCVRVVPAANMALRVMSCAPSSCAPSARCRAPRRRASCPMVAAAQSRVAVRDVDASGPSSAPSIISPFLPFVRMIGPGRAGPVVLIACPESLSPCASHCLYWEYPHCRLARRR